MSSEGIPSDFWNECNTIKLLLFIESEPLSDHYEQMMFTKEDMIKIRAFISKEILGEKPVFDEDKGEVINQFRFTTEDEVVINVPNARDYYSKEEIEGEL